MGRFLMSIKVWVFIEVCHEIFCKSRFTLYVRTGFGGEYCFHLRGKHGTPRVVYDLRERERERLKSFSFLPKQTIAKGQKSLRVFVICALLSVRMFHVDNSENCWNR